MYSIGKLLKHCLNSEGGILKEVGWLHLDMLKCESAMLLVSSCVPVITWLYSRGMRLQSRPTNWPLLNIKSPVAQWLEHPTRSRRVVGSNPIWDSDFFPSSPCI